MKTILQKLLPIDRLIQLGLKFGLLKAPLELLGKVSDKAKGVRTEVLIAIAVIVTLAGSVGIVPADQVKEINTMLLAASAPTLLDKISRVVEALGLLKDDSQV